MNARMLLAAALALTIALPAAAQVREPAANTRTGDAPQTRAPRTGDGARHTRARHHRWARHLDLTAEQRTLVRDEVKHVAPQVRELRERARELVRAARKDGELTPQARETLRTRLRALRDEARGDALPSARKLVQSLTPAQRERLATRAQARGKTLDDAKLAERVAARMARRLGHARGAR